MLTPRFFYSVKRAEVRAIPLGSDYAWNMCFNSKINQLFSVDWMLLDRF